MQKLQLQNEQIQSEKSNFSNEFNQKIRLLEDKLRQEGDRFK